MSKIWDQIEKFAGDISSLEVLTLSGKITFQSVKAAPAAAEVKDGNNVKTPALTGLTDLSRLFQSVAQSVKLDDSEIRIVAYTRGELDHDTVIFVDQNADPTLLAAHNATVTAAHQARYEALSLLAKAVGSRL